MYISKLNKEMINTLRQLKVLVLRQHAGTEKSQGYARLMVEKSQELKRYSLSCVLEILVCSVDMFVKLVLSNLNFSYFFQVIFLL